MMGSPSKPVKEVEHMRSENHALRIRTCMRACCMLFAGAICWQAVIGHSQTVSPAAGRWGQAAPLLEAVGEQAGSREIRGQFT